MQGMGVAGSAAYTGMAAFLFRDTSSHELDMTMRSLAACRKPKAIPWPGWVFPSNAPPLLDFHLVEDVNDYAMDLLWESWKWYVPLLGALGAEPENTVMLTVYVRDEAAALSALRTFSLKLLQNHTGVVKDNKSEQIWTREEIATNSTRTGRVFFGGSGVSRDSDTA